MGTEGPKDPFKAMQWKDMGTADVQKEPSTGPVVKKRLPRKIRQIPDCYFLPRMSKPTAIAFLRGMDCWWNWCRDAVRGLDKEKGQRGWWWCRLEVLTSKHGIASFQSLDDNPILIKFHGSPVAKENGFGLHLSSLISFCLLAVIEETHLVVYQIV